MICDTSVARNFAVLGWADILESLCSGTITLAAGVIAANPGDPGELEAAKAHFDDEGGRGRLGSREQTDALAASNGLAALLAKRSTTITIVTPTAKELALAVRLQDPSERAWRRSLGLRARRLDAGEAVSIAIAVTRDEPLATDDEDGARAFLALEGTSHKWTRDLFEDAVAQELLSEAIAREGYERLRNSYSFRAPPW